MKNHVVPKLNLSFSLVILFLTLTTTGCKEDFPNVESPDFSIIKLGLENTRVNQILLKKNMLYAMTSMGIYVKNIDSQDGFRNLGFEGKNIEDAVVFSENDILVSFRDIIFFSELDPAIYRTTDGGETWQQLESNFGGGEFPEAFNDFEVHPTIPNLIYGTGTQIIAKSTDFGISWEPIWGDWKIFGNRMRMAINPYAADEIWAGGQGAIENGFLVYLKGEEEVGFWNGLVPNPTVVKEIVFDNLTPQAIYVGWEGELAKTTDKGATWQTLIDKHEEAHFFMGIGISQTDQNLVFSGKWIKTEDEQPLELFYSFDRGNNWNTEKFPGVRFGGVQDLIVKSESGRERIFLGLDKGGVYEINMIK